MAGLPDGVRPPSGEERRAFNSALVEHRLNEISSEMSRGFIRLESKVDSNLEALSSRIERETARQQEQIDLHAQRAADRAEALAAADSILAERVDGRLAALEADTLGRVDALEKWRITQEATVRALQESREGGLKTKHLWIAALGLVIAFGSMILACAAIVVTVVLTSQ